MADPRLEAQLPYTLSATDFPALGEKYTGKVRDTYRSGDRLVLVTTDRLSAFDRVLTTLPFKGDVLNQLAHFWFQKTAHVVKNHVIDVPDPAVVVARRAEPIRVEFVVRGFVSGSLWREYQAGIDSYGLKLPPGLRRDEMLPKPVLTPSTKAPIGQHDEPIPEAEVLARGLATPKVWQRAKEAALAIFAEGQRHAASQGLILADTKYELGLIGDELLLIDELHTPDSSRFWVADGSKERFERGEPQRMLDKENLRQWLLTEHNFSGHGEAPTIPDGLRVSLAATYLSAAERIMGYALPLEVGSVQQRMRDNLRRAKLL